MVKRPEFLNLAQILTTFGVRGELKIRPETDDPLRLRQMKQVTALLSDGTRETLEIEDVKLRKDGSVLLKLKGFDAPEPLAKYRQAWLQIPFSEAKRPKGKVLYADVLGLAVVDDATEERLGTVVEIYKAAQDILAIETPDGREVLMPWVDEFVKAIDLEKEEVRLNVLPGFFDEAEKA